MKGAKVNHAKKTVVLNAEGIAACKRSGPSNARIKQIVLSHEERHMPASWEARWLGAAVLFYNGYEFTPPIKLKQKVTK